MRKALRGPALLQPQRMLRASMHSHGTARSRSLPSRDLRVVGLRQTAIGTRGIVIQRRFLLGPIFRVARSGVAVATGAAAGTVAYAHHKFGEASNAVSDKLDRASDWISGVWDKVHLPDVDFSAGKSGSDADGGAAQASNGSGGASSNGTRDSGNGGSDGSSGSGGSNGSGGPGGGQGDAAAAGAVAAAVPASLEPTYDEQVDEMDDQMINLTGKMIEIRNVLQQIDGSDKVQLPSIVVIGSQSSGKSSVLEAIVGHEFLPKGSNMVTRRPIEMTLVHTNSNSASEYCEFPALRLGHITNFRDVQKTLTDLNRAVPDSQVVSDEPIQLRVYSPHVPDLTLIDLPGYIQVVAADQPIELKQRIAELCEKYIQPPNVILAVSAADVDLANSTALRASRRVDPDGQRTIGVITKMDLVDAVRGRSILTTREYPLRMGYVGVVTRAPSNMSSSLFGSGGGNLTKTVAEHEQKFFDDPEYRGINWGVIQLRQKLMRVLEKSMSASLEPTTRGIRKELEETAYDFKVQYNDRVLTPQTFLAQSADAFKVSFQGMSQRFGRDQVRELIKEALDQKALDLLAENYWNSPPGLRRDAEYLTPPASPSRSSTSASSSPSPSSLSPVAGVAPDIRDLSSSKPDMLFWKGKVDQLSASLTKLGIGRLSTSLLVDAITERMRDLEADSPFSAQPLALQQIDEATEKILSSKFYSTADQIENSIKPYKYEVDLDAREWSQSREYAYNLLKEELRQCNAAYEAIKNEVGAKKLSKLIDSLGSLNPSENLDHFSASLISKARAASFLRDRAELLKARSTFIRSSKCKSSKNKALCPEVFMDVVSSKLASTAVLFLNFELLSDFYYSFPREFDAKLQSLTEEDVEKLATQDPQVKKHVDLQHRKELLQLALSKLQTINDIRNLEERRFR